MDNNISLYDAERLSEAWEKGFLKMWWRGLMLRILFWGACVLIVAVLAYSWNMGIIVMSFFSLVPILLSVRSFAIHYTFRCLALSDAADW